MIRIRFWIILAAAAASLGIQPAIAQKITVDPNIAKGTQEYEDQSEETDVRLAQKVTFEAQRKTVLAILTDLSEQTGVKLKAGQNNKDWQVRDRKMNIFAKDVPLAALMNSIARVMKFKWRREGEEGAEPTYRLYMNRKTLLDAETRLQRENERLERELRLKREKTLAKFAEVDELTPEQLENLKEENPFLYAASKLGMAKPLGGFFSEVPAAFEALASGQEMMLNAGALSPSAQQSLAAAVRSMWKAENTIMGRAREFPEDLLSDMNAVSVRINSHLSEMRGLMPAGFMLGNIDMRCGERHFGVPLMDPESNFAKLIGRMLVRSIDEGKSMESIVKEMGSDMQGEFMKAITSDVKQADFGEKPVEQPDEPALHEKIKLEPESDRLYDLQAAIARATKLAVVSDYFGRSEITRLSEREGEIKTILDKIGELYRYNWQKRGPVIEFWSRDWYRRRAAQIPEAWLEAWRETLKNTGTLDLGDLAQIAVLDMEQITVNIQEDPVLLMAGLMNVIYPNRELLRLYAGLTDAQRAMLFAEGGLDLRSLAPEQWKQAEKLISARNAAFLQNPDARIAIACTRAPKDKRFEYTFTLTCTDQDKPIEWKFLTPEYKEAAKEQPKPADKEKSPTQRG